MAAALSRDYTPVTLIQSKRGAQIYRIPVQQFPMLSGYVYLVLYQDPQLGAMRVLIDTGSGFGDCNSQLEAGLQFAADQSGQPVLLQNLTHILITHGHIDHFGGLPYIQPRTQAQIGVHELDRRNLTHYEERLAVVARRLDEFLIEAGVRTESRSKLLEMYRFTKSLYRSVSVDFTYEAVGMHLGPFTFLHTPGHCAGHVVIRLDEILFSGDQVLAQISPHQSPEHLTLSTGLDHYLRSLNELAVWADDVELTLAGHKEPITDLPGRLHEIRELHKKRLCLVLEFLSVGHTIADVSHTLFGEVSGYNVLLALQEAGAHVEYLYQRGLLGIENLSELEQSGESFAIRYRRQTDCVGAKFV